MIRRHHLDKRLVARIIGTTFVVTFIVGFFIACVSVMISEIPLKNPQILLSLESMVSVISAGVVIATPIALVSCIPAGLIAAAVFRRTTTARSRGEWVLLGSVLGVCIGFFGIGFLFMRGAWNNVTYFLVGGVPGAIAGLLVGSIVGLYLNHLSKTLDAEIIGADH